MKKSRYAALAASFAAVTLFAAAPAFAGEVNGNGDPIPATDHAASICAFSGLNDHPNGEGGDFPGRVQSFGAFVEFIFDLVGVRYNPLDFPFGYPGGSCQGN